MQDATAVERADPWQRRVVWTVVLVKAALLAISWLSLSTTGDEARPFASDGTPLFAWDSHHYARILESGYPEAPSRSGVAPDGAIGKEVILIGFFPGFPLLARPLAAFLSAPVALLVVANVLSALGYVLAFRWARDLYGPRVAFLAVLIALAYPPAFFASAAYSEAPFLFFSALVLLLLGRGRFLPAAVVAGIGSFFRPTGGLLGVLVVVELWRQGAVSWRTARGRAIAWTLALGLVGQTGALAYEAYLTARYDDWLVYVRGQEHWTGIPERRANLRQGHASSEVSADATDVDTTSGAPRSEAPVVAPGTEGTTRERAVRQGARERPGFLGRLRRGLTSLGAWNKALALALAATIVAGLVRPGRIPRTLFLLPAGVLLLGYLPGLGARITCLPRFGLVALPCFLFLAAWLERRRTLASVLIVAAFLHQLVLAWAFTRGIWTG